MNPIWKAYRAIVRLIPPLPCWIYIGPQKAEKAIGEIIQGLLGGRRFEFDVKRAIFLTV